MTWKHTDQNILSVVLQAPGVIVLASPAPVKHTGGDVWQQTNKDYIRQNVLHGGLRKPKWGSVKLCQVKLARHESATVMWERSTQLTVVSRPQINSRWRRKPRDGPSGSQHGRRSTSMAFQTMLVFWRKRKTKCIWSFLKVRLQRLQQTTQRFNYVVGCTINHKIIKIWNYVMKLTLQR